jgi:trigger factor
VAIADADVEQMIERLRQQRAEWEAVDRAAADGDRVVVDFEGKIAGNAFEGGEGKEIAIVVGEGQVIADFEKALLGRSQGDETTAKVKFPKDYAAAEIAGKKAEFSIKVHRVEEQRLPPVDAEFMEAFGITDGDEAAFKAEVRKNMQRELDERQRTERKNRVLDALHDANRIDVPRALIDQEIRTLQSEAMRRMGVNDPAEAPGPENFRGIADKRVRLGLLVQELIVAHKLELDRRRVDERIGELASPYEKPEEAAQLYRSNRDLMGQVESTVLEEQVVDYLIEQGQQKTRDLAFDEFMNMQDA